MNTLARNSLVIGLLCIGIVVCGCRHNDDDDDVASPAVLNVAGLWLATLTGSTLPAEGFRYELTLTQSVATVTGSGFNPNPTVLETVTVTGTSYSDGHAVILLNNGVSVITFDVRQDAVATNQLTGTWTMDALRSGPLTMQPPM